MIFATVVNPIDEGVSKIGSKDEREAMRLYKVAADHGDATAQNNLGVFYEKGRGGLSKDDQEAARLYKLAAEQGHAGAQYNLGVMYEEGRGVPRDDAAAFIWYRTAADQGHATAQNNLGGMYVNSRDYAAAAGWVRKAADQGDAAAQCNLGFMYEQGRGGLPRDDAVAVSWYRKAADQGNAGAQCNLGVMYEQGRGGLRKDDAVAVSWYRKAAEQGNATAQSNLGFMFEQGRGGLPRDDREATCLFELAADQGNATAQGKLASIYAGGHGAVPKDGPARLDELAADQPRAAQRDLVEVFSSNDRSGLMSGWFKSNSHLAVDILKRADDWGNVLFGAPIAIGVFFGWRFAVVSGGLTAITLGLLNWWASWAPCSHGIPRGKTENRCETCVREQKEIEETRRRERELQERQKRIDTAADRLRDTERLRLAKSLVPNIEELRGLSWQQFEDEVARMFERMGFTVEQTPYVNDLGRDAILRKDGKKYLLECKKYAEGNVSGRPDLQKFHSAMITDVAVSGFFVTAGGFTKEAIEFAAKVRMELIDQDKLVRVMFDSKPDPAEEDSYRSMCQRCEDIVSHRLRAPQSARCRNGHEVAPTLLNFESLLPASAWPQKIRRGRRGFEKPRRSARLARPL
jgi:TPR repeat protein/HJR/Mrr/RecB family endonuclease